VVETITPTTPPITMRRSDIHRLLVTAVTGGIWSISISELLVTYVL
jgi:hypothetical protein